MGVKERRGEERKDGWIKEGGEKMSKQCEVN